MRILYDGMIYAAQGAGGINRYFAEIIDGLPDDIQPTLMVRERRGLHFPTRPTLEVAAKSYDFRPGRAARWMERSSFRRSAAGRFDVAHPTYYSLLTGRQVSDYLCPVVVTVYDMIHEIFGDQLEEHQRHVAEQKRKAVLAAQAVICISESTKRDLLERCPIPEERVTVTPLASDIDEPMSYGEEKVPERPYFLYVGGRVTYKNFGRLLTAFARVASERPDLALCVVGSAFTDEEKRAIAGQRLSDRVENFGHVDDNHLAKLYRCSLAFVYPSLYEGFGIPPLEAMACGTVVIAADSSSIPEVIGDAGLLFDPYSVDALVDSLDAIINDRIPRATLVERGRRQAEKFSWQRTVDQTLGVYRSLTSKGLNEA